MSRDAVKDCVPLGVVDASDDVSGGTAAEVRPAEPDAVRRVRAAAARAGANMVLLSDTPTGMSSGTQLRGEAYKCSRPE